MLALYQLSYTPVSWTLLSYRLLHRILDQGPKLAPGQVRDHGVVQAALLDLAPEGFRLLQGVEAPLRELAIVAPTNPVDHTARSKGALSYGSHFLNVSRPAHFGVGHREGFREDFDRKIPGDFQRLGETLRERSLVRPLN